MIKWEKEGFKAPAIAKYSLGLISLSALAKEIGGTTLEAMQLLTSAGFKSPYTLQDYRAEQDILKDFLNYRPPTKEEKNRAKRGATNQGKQVDVSRG